MNGETLPQKCETCQHRTGSRHASKCLKHQARCEDVEVCAPSYPVVKVDPDVAKLNARVAELERALARYNKQEGME